MTTLKKTATQSKTATLERRRRYYKANCAYINECKKKAYQKNHDKIKKMREIRLAETREHTNAVKRDYYNRHRDKLTEIRRKKYITVGKITSTPVEEPVLDKSPPFLQKSTNSKNQDLEFIHDISAIDEKLDILYNIFRKDTCVNLDDDYILGSMITMPLTEL